MKRSFVAVLGVALCAGLAVALWWQQADSQRRQRQRTAAPENAELMALRNQVSSLKRQVNAVAVEQARVQEEPASSADGATAASAEPVAAHSDVAPPAELTPEQEEKLFGTYFGQLDRRRNAEARDGAWQTQVERRVHDVLAGELGGSAADTVECGATLCRVQVRHKDLRSQRFFTQQFHLQLGTFLPEASMYSPPGSLTTQVHLIREGHSLPRP